MRTACVAAALATLARRGAAQEYDGGWIRLFNGRDLTGWTVKIAGHDVGEDFANTFRVEAGVLKVGYEGYRTFNAQFGHLFSEQPFSDYHLVLEYRFVGEWLADTPGWARRNSGAMLHAQDPRTMRRDQDFPISIELQLLGGLGDGRPRPTANLCTPGTEVSIGGEQVRGHCVNSSSRTHDGDGWVRVEAFVYGDSLITHVVEGDTVLRYERPRIGGGNVEGHDPAQKVDGRALTAGFIALQSEGHPIEFRRVDLRRLRRPDVPRLAVMSAFEAELTALRAATRITGTRVVNGRTHYLGVLEGHEVVLMLSGFSMVNAAMTTQALLDRYDIRAIVFSGIAGGVNPGLAVGDVTVPAQWGNYQESVFARETAHGFETERRTTDFPNHGMMFPQGTSVTVRGAPADSLERRFWFPVDTMGLRLAREVAATVTLRRCTDQGDCLGHEPRVVVGGNGVSGPTFVDNAAYREWAWRAFQADALDMETAAVAIVAYENRVPYIAFRSLSDLAGGGPGRNEVRVFGRLAAENSAALVRAYLRALPRVGAAARP